MIPIRYATHPDTGQRYVRMWVVEVRDGTDLVFSRLGSLECCEAIAAKRPRAVVTEVLPPNGNYVQDPDDLCWTFVG